MKIVSPQLFLEKKFIFLRLLSPLSTMFAKYGQNPPRSGTNWEGRKGKTEDKLQCSLKVAIQDTSYPQCTTKVCSGHSETRMETCTPTASLGQGLTAPGWAEMGCGATGCGQPQGDQSGLLRTARCPQNPEKRKKKGHAET